MVAELLGGYIELREGDVAVHPVAEKINAGKGARCNPVNQRIDDGGGYVKATRINFLVAG